MKIMILSDSHSMTKQTLLNFINQHPADYYIHCGDIYMPYSPLEIDNFYNVRGNNEALQRAELHRKIWAIADDVRGAVDGWDLFVMVIFFI